MTEQQRHLPSASTEIEPQAAIAVDLQQPLREFIVEGGTLCSPFTKTLYIDFPPLPLWSSLSELSEMLPPGLQSSFCPQ